MSLIFKNCMCSQKLSRVPYCLLKRLYNYSSITRQEDTCSSQTGKVSAKCSKRSMEEKSLETQHVQLRAVRIGASIGQGQESKNSVGI